MAPATPEMPTHLKIPDDIVVDADSFDEARFNFVEDVAVNDGDASEGRADVQFCPV